MVNKSLSNFLEKLMKLQLKTITLKIYRENATKFFIFRQILSMKILLKVSWKMPLINLNLNSTDTL